MRSGFLSGVSIGALLTAGMWMFGCADPPGGGDDDMGGAGGSGGGVPFDMGGMGGVGGGMGGMGGGMGGMGGGMGGAGGGDLQDSVPPGTADAFADEICAWLERCGTDELVELGLNEDCRPYIARQFEDQTLAALAPALAAGTVGFDPARSQACLQGFAALDCATDLTMLGRLCDEAFVGLAPAGGACTIDDECGAGQFCAIAGACPGSCSPRGAQGAACDAEALLSCADGLFCVRGTCQPPNGQGQPCGENFPPCAGGLGCDAELGADEGTCEPIDDRQVGEGQTCGFNGPFCQGGLSCVLSGFELVCRTPVGAGEVCSIGFPEHCQPGLYCSGVNLDIFDFEGTCAPVPALGQPCADGALFEVCGRGAVCDARMCRARARNGEPCGIDTTCYSGRCDAGTCAAPDRCAP